MISRIWRAGNLFDGIPVNSPDEQFETLIGTTSCRLERIISIGHATPTDRWYDQAWDEWVVLLQGQAGLRFADPDTVYLLNPGDYLHIPAHCRHRVDWTSQKPPAIWLALHVIGSADSSS